MTFEHRFDMKTKVVQHVPSIWDLTLDAWYFTYLPLVSIDMKRKVVQYVPRINISTWNTWHTWNFTGSHFLTLPVLCLACLSIIKLELYWTYNNSLRTSRFVKANYIFYFSTKKCLTKVFWRKYILLRRRKSYKHIFPLIGEILKMYIKLMAGQIVLHTALDMF